MDSAKYICIDIGGTSIKYGVSNEQGEFIHQGSVATEAKKYGGPGIVQKVKEIIKKYNNDFKVKGVAMSTAGMVDPEAGEVVYALEEAIPNYTGTKWQQLIEAEFGLKCTVENDVNCAALGELWLGAAKGKTSAFCMTIGTSIGGAVVCDGKIVHGVSNSAGEIAYIMIPQGRLHDLVSTTRLVADVAAAKHLPKEELDGCKIFQMAHEDDEVVRAQIDKLMENLADGINNIAMVLNPQIFVLGGGIMEQKEYLTPILSKHLANKMVSQVLDSTEIAFACLGNQAGMVGALYNFLQSDRK